MPNEHLFECHLTWTGAGRGPRAEPAREARLAFAGKPPLSVSAAAAFRGDPTRPNPEDLLVAALAACHFLAYEALCARAGIELRAYEDTATGTIAWDRRLLTFRFREVVLRPRVTLAGGADRARALALHADAGRQCFIAASVNFPVRREPTVLID